MLIVVFIILLLLQKGQVGEACEPSTSAVLLDMCLHVVSFFKVFETPFFPFTFELLWKFPINGLTSLLPIQTSMTPQTFQIVRMLIWHFSVHIHCINAPKHFGRLLPELSCILKKIYIWNICHLRAKKKVEAKFGWVFYTRLLLDNILFGGREERVYGYAWRTIAAVRPYMWAICTAAVYRRGYILWSGYGPEGQ